MKEIDVVICIRDREQERVERCVKYLRKCENIKNIFVMDNSLVTPITPFEGAEVIRLEYSDYWNKSWVLNKGIKLCKSQYIMTIDVDIILSEEILNKIVDFLGERNVIFNKNILRLKQFNICEDYQTMLKSSYPWFPEAKKRVYHDANGGIQVMPLGWIESVNGYDENAGLLWGGMDNRVFEQAVLDGMSVIDINIPMIHVEHKNKEENLKDEDKNFALTCRGLKRLYLDGMINMNKIENLEEWGGEKPNDNFMRKLTENEIDKNEEFLKKETNKYKSLGYKGFVYNGAPVYIE